MGKPENCCSVQFMILVQVYTLGGVGWWGGEGGGLSICEYRVPGLCGNWVCWKQHHSIDMQLDAGFECNYHFEYVPGLHSKPVQRTQNTESL